MNINLYRRRRLRSTQAILTRVQIRDVGKMLGYTSFRKSVEFLMDPYNYFKLSKIQMADLHQYLLDKGITKEKRPNSHIRQGDHSRVLISILFPGYPIIKASEQFYRDLRENRTSQAKVIDLAYDQLPTSDKYERLEELFRTPVDWYKQDNKSKQYTVDIPLKKLNRSIVIEGHASSQVKVCLFLYLWSSERMAWNPSDISLSMDEDSSKDILTEMDKKTNSYGFDHIDITDKSPLITKANRRSTGSITLKFMFHSERPIIRHVSVCAVIEKSPEEMTSQLYLQTASLYIGRAMEQSNKNIPEAERVQKEATQLLNKYTQNDKLCLEKMQHLLMTCAETFLNSWNDQGDKGEEEEEEAEVALGGQFISVLDPLLLSKIEHPARGIFCTHATTFDAKVFFRFQVKSRHWKCPVCQIKFGGIQDLYIDYHTKTAIDKYPDEERFRLEDGNIYTPLPSVDELVRDSITLDDEAKPKRIKL